MFADNPSDCTNLEKLNGLQVIQKIFLPEIATFAQIQTVSFVVRHVLFFSQLGSLFPRERPLLYATAGSRI